MKPIIEIKQIINRFVSGIEGIGKVYDRFIYAFDIKQVKDFFSSGGKINTLMFRSTERSAEGGEGITAELSVRRIWKFRLIYGYNYDENSERAFDELCERICGAFNSDSSIRAGINRSTFLEIKDKYDSEYHGVLVHNAEMEMITKNN